ncbi:MAG: amidase [Pseudomonadota bacterium]|nr:amidase [Pseudomonadota bacterium]
MTKPCELSATEARRLIGLGRLSPVELLESCIRRIDAVNPAVNAVVTFDYEGARRIANEQADAVARGEELGALHGLPIGVKDLQETVGMRTTFGSLLYEDYVPNHDDLIVARLKAAGANIFCKTNTPEFGAGANTRNSIFGATGNPFDPTRICGGSSGGSGVALATNMMPLATGNDSGGSLRVPAAINGIVSHRSTPGLIPSARRNVGYTNFAVEGPMARSVEDMVLMMSTMVDYDDSDMLAFPRDPAGYRVIQQVDLNSLRVAFSEDLGFCPVDNGFRAIFRERMKIIEPIFKSVVWRDPDLSTVEEVNWVLRCQLFIARHRERYENNKDKLGPNVIMNYEAAQQIQAERVSWAHQQQTVLFKHMQRFFDDVDILICPCVGVSPFPHEQWYPDKINGEKLENYIQWIALTWALTIPGNPVTAIPCGYEPSGTPFGLQIVGKHHDDRRIIGAAKALEEHFQGYADLKRPVPEIAKLEVAA